jgi:SAM-dependent methyltransferase
MAGLEMPASGVAGDTDQLLIEELLMLEGAMARNYEWVYEIIAPCLRGRVLEVGSGVGVMSRFLVERGGPIVLSDHHPAYLRHLRSRFGDRPHVALQLLDLNQRPYAVDAAVDTVVCLNVLEHVADDRAALAGLVDLLPIGGRLVLQVPNYPRLFGSLDETYGHFRRYTRRSLDGLLAAAGYTIVEMRNFNPLAIPGWVVSGKLLRSRRLNVGSVKLFNALVPLVRRLDFLARIGGLALIVCAEKRHGPAPSP